MQNQNTLITNAYYLISEGIILYLLVLPVSFYYFQSTPFWYYLAILFGVSVLFSICARMMKNYVPFVISIPVITIAFYFISYPLGLSIALASIIAWRYIAIRSKVFHQNESAYMIAAVLLTFLGFFIVRDLNLTVIPLVQMAVIMVGFTFSHLLEIKREERKAFHRSVWIKWIGFFSVLTLLVYLFSDSLTSIAYWIWDMLGSGLTLLITGVVKVFDFLHFNQFISKNSNKEAQEIDMETPKEKLELPDMVQHDGNLNAFLFIVIGVLLIVFIIALYRAMRYKTKSRKKGPDAVFEQSVEKIKERKQEHVSSRRKRVRHTHPVRKWMYQLERKAAKWNVGRFHHETIEDWFIRIGVKGDTDTDIYQKVRYGEKEVTSSEKEKIKKTLRLLEEEIVKLEPED